MKFAIMMLLLSFPGWAKWSVSTYNIRNFDNDLGAGPTDLIELGKIIKDVQSDVMVFEEVNNAKAFDVVVKRNLPGYEYKLSSCGGFGKQFLAVVYNPKTFDYIGQEEDLTFSGSTNSCGSLRPLLLVTLKNKTTNTIYTFAAAHLKAGGNDRAMAQRWQQYAKLEVLAKAYDKKNLILLGDLNTTGYNIKDQDFVKFEEFMNGSKMRTMTEAIGCTNYWTGTLGGEEHQSSILDHIVIHDKNVSSVDSVKVGAHCARTDCRPSTPEELGVSYQSVSDHCPVQVTFK